MPVKGVAITGMHFMCVNSYYGYGVTGENYGTLTMYIVNDYGTAAAIAGDSYIAEVSATYMPGLMKVPLTLTENAGDVVTLHGTSSTSGVSVVPVTWHNSLANLSTMNTKLNDTYNVASGNSGKLDTIDNFIDTEVAAILTDTGTTLNDKIDVIDGIVDAILVDTGTTLNTKLNDTYNVASTISGAVDGAISELGSVPAAAPTLKQAVMLIYMALRNKTETTEGTKKIHNDAGTAIAESTLTDDGTTFTKGEYA